MRLQAPGVAASNMSTAVLLLADVKAANRELTLSVEDLRGKVQSASAAADAHDLSLQNLLYEKHHLLREIRKCKELATPEFDKINFVAVDDMVQSNPALASSDDHALTLNRLQHELQARKELEAQLEAVKQRVVAQQELNKGKTTYLQTLPVQLKALESAAAPFVSRLGLPSSAAATRHARTLGLPGPLYTAYSQLEALLDLASQPVPFGSDGGGSRASAAAKWMAVDVCAAVAPALDGTLPTTAISVPADRLSGLQGTGITVTRLEGQASVGATSAASSSSSSGAAAVAVGGGARKRKRADSSAAADGGACDDDDADVGTEPEEGVAAASHSTGSSDISILSPVKMAVVATGDCFKPHPKAVLIAFTLGEGGVCCGIRLQYYPLLDVVTAAAVEPSELATAAAVVAMLQGSAAKPTAAAPSAAAAAASGPSSSSTTSAAAVTSSAATSSTPLTVVSVPANVLAHLLGSGDDGSTHPRWTQALVASGVCSVAATGGTGVPRVPLSTSSSSSSQPGGLPYHWLDALSGCGSAAASVPPQGYGGPPPSSVSVASLIASLRSRLFVSAQVARQVGVLVKAPSQLYSQLVQPELKTINGAAHCASVSNKLLSLHKSSTAELLKIGGAALADAQAVMPVIASMLQLLGERLSTATPVPAPATLVSLQQLTGRAAVAAEGIIGGHASSSAASSTADAVDSCQYLQATYTLTASKGPKATGGSYSTSNVQLTVVAFIRLPLSFPSSSPSAPGTSAGAGVAAPAVHLLVSGINAIGNKPVMLVNVPASAAAAGNMTNSLLTGIDVSVGQVPATAADAGGGGGAAVGLARLASLLTASTSLLCPSPSSLLHALPHLLFVLGHILPASLARPAKLDLSSEAAAASLTGLASPLPPIHHMCMAASGGGKGWAPGGHVKLAAVTGEDGTGIQLQWRA